MKLLLGEIRPMMEALNVVMDKEIPAKTAYWLSKALKELGSEFEAMEKARQTLVNKYAKKDDEDQLIVEDNQYVMEDMAAFNAEFIELAEQEIEIKYKPISVDQLGDIQIKGTDLFKLGKLIKDDEEEENEPYVV